MKDTIYFNYNTNSELNIGIKGSIPYPIPNLIYEDVEGPGGENLTKIKGYEDIIIPITINILDRVNLRETIRKISRWLRVVEDNKLKILDDPEYFYKVKKINTDNFERELNFIGETTIEFICSPFRLSELDQSYKELKNNSILYNCGDVESECIIKIEGEGLTELTVNNNTVTVNVGQNIIIDSEKRLTYRIDGTMQNNKMSGEYPILKVGPNNISWKGGNINKVSIIQNERYF